MPFKEIAGNTPWPIYAISVIFGFAAVVYIEPRNAGGVGIVFVLAFLLCALVCSFAVWIFKRVTSGQQPGP